MPDTLLRTKLHIPSLRPNLVSRPGLIQRLNQGLQFGRKLTLISAPAGFGKTTLVAEWVNQKDEKGKPSQVAWLSLDEGDSDPARFLTYLVAALQTISADIGQGALAMLQSPQPPLAESVLTAVVNEIDALPDANILVLDDYHLIRASEVAESTAVNGVLAFLLEHLPPQLHLVIATREDPDLPLARLRAGGQLTELRAVDLRFTPVEAAAFFNQAMGLKLSTEHIAALEERTEGWIAGLQLAALALQGQTDTGDTDERIRAFTGSHRFVLDYLLAEVLGQQPESVQAFLLKTAVLERLTGSLCDALTGLDNGRRTLEYLEQANLFIMPLDDERRWYRYHHLFADLLRRRLGQSDTALAEEERGGAAELHRRASRWFEENGLEIEAFQHAATANDIERAERLLEGDGLPLVFRGAVAPVLKWLASLPKSDLDARPSLWVDYGMAKLVAGQLDGVEEKLQAAESALEGAPLDDETRDIIGRIADTRGTIAVGLRQTDIIIEQSRRALEFLRPDNLAYRTSTTWKLGVAYEFQGDRAAASQAYQEAISISQEAGNVYTRILATVGLGNIHLAENQLREAVETYQNAMELVGDLPIPVACYVHLCQARIFYEWNDLDGAQERGQQSLQLARQYVDFNDILVTCQIFLARVKLAQGDMVGGNVSVDEARQVMRQYEFVQREAEVAGAQVLILLRQGDLAAAAELVGKHELPLAKARVHLAQGKAAEAVALLAPLRQKMQARGWADELLKVTVLEAVAQHAHGDDDKALQRLEEALALGEPAGFIRTFLDEGPPVAALLAKMDGGDRGQVPSQSGSQQAYIKKLLTAFAEQKQSQASDTTQTQPSPLRLRSVQALRPSPGQAVDSQPLLEPLSERELEVLQLVAEGLSNPEIASRLYLSPNTVKVHTRNIYGKLDVHSRTQAVARALELGLLPPRSV